MTTLSSTVLIHEPFGNEHPFHQGPAERIPRNPVAGEAVILGVKTQPRGCFSEVGGTWSKSEGEIDHLVSGIFVSSEGEFDHWQIKLPPFSGGDCIHYRIHGQVDEHRFETEWFSFSVMDWVRLDRFCLVYEGTEGPVLLLSDAAGKVFLRLTQQFSKNGTLTFNVYRYETESAAQAASPDHPVPVHGVETPASYKIEGQGYEITFSNRPFRFAVLRTSDRFALQSHSVPEALLDGDGQIVRVRLNFMSPESEAFFGFGERFNALNQRGCSLENRVIDTYTNHGVHSYFPVPFFVSSRGYGVWINSNRWMKFDMAREDPHAWQVESEVGESQGFEARFFLQPSPKAIIQEFTRHVGRAPMPPAWVFGLWMSSNDWNSQVEVMRQLALAREHDIPATVLVIEAWSDEVNFYIWNGSEYALKPAPDAYRYSDFTFPAGGYWSDPKGMIEEIHKTGMRFILWQIPVIKKCGPEEVADQTQNMADEEFAIQEGYCVKKSSGAPYRVLNFWFHDSLLIDFTNPRAGDWWLSKRRYLVEELGVDGFKTDGGEHLWEHEARLYDGTTGRERINSYPLLYLSTYDRCLKSWRGKDSVLFSRAGYTGAQRYSCHWSGDDLSTWDAFRTSVLAMLNMGISGVPFVGWDIAGFAGEIPTSELYLRAAAFSALCPIMQYHSDSNYRRKPSHDRTPWNIQERTGDERVIPIFRQFTNLRMNLLPYLVSQAWQSTQTGLPLMRALALEFPGDPECRNFPYQYLLGEALLVAPVLEDGKISLPVYFPEGEWRELWTGKVYEGQKVSDVLVPLDRIPVFQRKGTILPLNLGEDFTLCSPVGNKVDRYQHLNLIVYSDGDCQVLLYQNGDAAQRVIYAKDDQRSRWEIELPPLECPVRITLLEVQAAEVLCDGKPLPLATNGTIDTPGYAWAFSPAENMTQIDLPPGAQAEKIIIGADKPPSPDIS